MNAQRRDIRISIVARNDANAKYLVEQLKAHPGVSVVGTINDSARAVAEARTRSADIVIIETDTLPKPGLDVAQELKAELPGIGIILVADQSGIGHFQEAIRLQVNDFLIKPFEGQELPESVSRTSRVLQSQPRRDAGRAPQPSATTIHGIRGRLISVVSSRGGTGKSLVASVLSSSLAGKYGNRLLLADLDLQYGDIDLLMGIKGGNTKTIRKLGGVLNELSPDAFESALHRGLNGMQVLLAPPSPLDAIEFETDSIESLLVYLKNSNPVTIVDTSSYLDEKLLLCMREADIVLIVVTPDLFCVRDTAKLIKVYRDYHYDPSKLHLVVNKVRSESDFNAKKISNSLGVNVLSAIPYAPGIVSNIINLNTGKTIPQAENKDLLGQIKALSVNIDKLLGI